MEHCKDNVVAPLCILLNVIPGFILRRVLDDSGKRGALDKRKFGNVFSEIGLRRGLNAVAIVSEIYDIEVHLEYLRLTHLFFKIEGAEYFLYLTLYFHLIFICQIFYKLLSER